MAPVLPDWADCSLCCQIGCEFGPNLATLDGTVKKGLPDRRRCQIGWGFGPNLATLDGMGRRGLEDH